MEKKQKVFKIINISLWSITLMLIVVLSLTNGEISQTQSGFFSNIYLGICRFFVNRPLLDSEVESAQFIVRKFLGHMMLFLLHGLFTFNLFKTSTKTRLLIVLGYGLLLSLLSEVFQLIAGGRTFALEDIVFDFISFSYFPIVFGYRYQSLTR